MEYSPKKIEYQYNAFNRRSILQVSGIFGSEIVQEMVARRWLLLEFQPY
jgi:hypothetical protein